MTVEPTGPAALQQALEGDFDLLILDLGLPGMDGLEVCRQIRAHRTSLAVLMLTARTDEVDFVVGLDAGADDYVSKPFRLAELMARVRAHSCVATVAARNTIVRGSVASGSSPRHDAYSSTAPKIALANKEYELLRVLLEHRRGSGLARYDPS